MFRVTRLAVLCAVGLAAVGAGASPFTIIAHRGASFDAPEHTFAAWDRALADGADFIEQDLQMTRDGQLVVMHDDSLDRTTRGDSVACRGLVRDRTLAELRRCDVGAWFNEGYESRAKAEFVGAPMPTMDSVLARYAGRVRFYIETKAPETAPGLEDSLVALLVRHRLVGAGAPTGDVVLQSFSAASLLRLRQLAPDVPRVLLIRDSVPAASLAAVMDSVATFAQGIGPSRRIVTVPMIEAAHARGLWVHVYTVNDTTEMLRFRQAGADGVFTDRAGLMKRTLGPR